MKKLNSSLNLLVAAIVIISMIGCGGGTGKQGPADQQETEQEVKKKGKQESDEEIRKKVLEQVQKKMKEAEENIKVMDAEKAYELALKEADKWDKDAKLYYLEGEKTLEPDGTAKQWTAYFAVREDPQNTPGREQGKKLVVLMNDARIMSVEAKETPDDISYTQDCYMFLPDGWMDSETAYGKCMDALKEKHGDDVENGEAQRLICRTGEFYINRKWVVIPAWELGMKYKDSYPSAEIHAVTGEILEVK